MVHCLYIDEVGNSDLKGAAADDNVRYLSLTGILTTTELHDARIRPRTEAIKSSLRVDVGNSKIVLHRREILRREGVFKALRDPVIASEFERQVLSTVDQAPYRAITVQIDKREHLDAYGAWHFDPYHYCLRCLVERYVLYLRRHNARGYVVIEPRFKSADKRLKDSFERTYRLGTENLAARTVQDHLVSKDIRFFPKASNVAGLQLADLIAHPSARDMRFRKVGHAMPDDFGAQIAKILVEHRYARNPRTQEIMGWGTKWLP